MVRAQKKEHKEYELENIEIPASMLLCTQTLQQEWHCQAAKAAEGFIPVTYRVQVFNTKVLRIWVRVIVVQVLGKYMSIGYLDP